MDDEGIFATMTFYDWFDAIRLFRPDLTWEEHEENWVAYWDERDRGLLN